jgi:glucose/mannose transport system substrate-binding protein
MGPVARIAAALALAGCCAQAQAARQGADIIHWWTANGEAAAARTMAAAYRAAGGVWRDSAIAGADTARAIAINRIVGGEAPLAAQFNTTHQYAELVDEGLLTPIDEVARREQWERILPTPVLEMIRVRGRYYGVPADIHMQAWMWYSKAAFRQAGIEREPASIEELFAALDKLKAAGLIPLAHGGQPWQENILFLSMLANVGGADLYMRVLRDRDPRAIHSNEFKRVLATFKRLKSYVDPGSPGRNWNDATALLIRGKAGIQVMGDWAKGEFAHAGMRPGIEYGCMPGLGPKAPYIIQSDIFVFPRSADPAQAKAQYLLASVIARPSTQAAFNKLKGSVPIRQDADTRDYDPCARAGMEIMRDRARQVGIGETYLTPDQNGEMQDVLTAFWNTRMPLEKAQRGIANALRDH